MSYLSEKHKGDSAEAVLLAECVLRGLNVSIPFGENQLYDLVVEHGTSGKLLKVQVKMRKEPDRLKKSNYPIYTFTSLGKYIGNVDLIAFLCGDDWYFWTNLKLKRYGVGSTVYLKTKHNVKNNWKVFGL